MPEHSQPTHGQPDYGGHLRRVADDVREWGDATPQRVRDRCLQAEAEVERLRAENSQLRQALKDVLSERGLLSMRPDLQDVVLDALALGGSQAKGSK